MKILFERKRRIFCVVFGFQEAAFPTRQNPRRAVERIQRKWWLFLSPLFTKRFPRNSHPKPSETPRETRKKSRTILPARKRSKHYDLLESWAGLVVWSSRSTARGQGRWAAARICSENDGCLAFFTYQDSALPRDDWQRWRCPRCERREAPLCDVSVCVGGRERERERTEGGWLDAERSCDLQLQQRRRQQAAFSSSLARVMIHQACQPVLVGFCFSPSLSHLCCCTPLFYSSHRPIWTMEESMHFLLLSFIDCTQCHQ